MIEKLFTLSFEHWKERVGEAFSKPFLSRGVEILDGGFARSKVNIDVSRIHIHSIVFFSFFFFLPSLLLNTRILSARSLDVSSCWFRVFRLSGVTSSSRGSLIKSRVKILGVGTPVDPISRFAALGNYRGIELTPK